MNREPVFDAIRAFKGSGFDQAEVDAIDALLDRWHPRAAALAPGMLSPHFSLAEFEASATAKARGIDNRMPAALIPAARALCVNVLEPLRAYFGKPVTISSGYRSPALNTAVGGSASSQHMAGEAADVKIAGVATIDVCRCIRDNLPFDQLILENVRRGQPTSGWTHVSYRDGRRRGDVRTKIIGEAGYPAGLIG